MNTSLPKTGYLRLNQILGQQEVSPEQARLNRNIGKGPRRPRAAITPLIPVSKATWWAGVRSGRFPKPVKLQGGNITLWRAEDIATFVQVTDGGVS